MMHQVLLFIKIQWLFNYVKPIWMVLVLSVLQSNGYAQELPKNFQASNLDQKTQAEKLLSQSGLQLAHPVLILDKWLPDLSVLVVFSRKLADIENTDVKIGFYTLAMGQWTLRDTAIIGGYGHYLKIVSALQARTKTGKHPKFFVISQLVGSEYGKRAASIYRTNVYWAEISSNTLDIWHDPDLSKQFMATPEYREDNKSTDDINGVKNAADLRRRLKELPW
jgi:hypothetical protein